MMENDLFYADTAHLIGSTSDRRLIRNIERSKSKADWRIIGESISKDGKRRTTRYMIPLGNRNKKKAMDFFEVTARKLE